MLANIKSESIALHTVCCAPRCKALPNSCLTYIHGKSTVKPQPYTLFFGAVLIMKLLTLPGVARNSNNFASSKQCR